MTTVSDAAFDLAAHLAVVAVDAFPDEGVFLDVPCVVRWLRWPWFVVLMAGRPSLVGDRLDFLERGDALP